MGLNVRIDISMNVSIDISHNIKGVPNYIQCTCFIFSSIKVGANRCHDPTGDICIMPQLGSGPWAGSSGSGHLTTQDYREILQYAHDRHIQVHW